ncbi:hypothetical protein HMPREF0322_03576 [Desulfitobacterium hafniense DP7]|nr:hypothetical protein HMPREF0322_03576 [Desulfitobacterium hafniense DP7]KTE90640.1 hypothetical protein AT727_07580 [Desulfitobacterium hafniense]
MDSMTHKVDDLNFSQIHCLQWIGTLENPIMIRIEDRKGCELTAPAFSVFYAKRLFPLEAAPLPIANCRFFATSIFLRLMSSPQRLRNNLLNTKQAFPANNPVPPYRQKNR